MNIIINNSSGSEIEVLESSDNTVVINVTGGSLSDEVKRGFSELMNPNSHSSKMLNQAIKVSRRR